MTSILTLIWNGLPFTFGQCANSRLYIPREVNIGDLVCWEYGDESGPFVNGIAEFRFGYGNLQVRDYWERLIGSSSRILPNVSVEISRIYSSNGVFGERTIHRLNQQFESDIGRLKRLENMGVPIIGKEERFIRRSA
jgi:hypothetical protein